MCNFIQAAADIIHSVMANFIGTVFEKCSPPAFQLVTADLGPAWCNYFKEQNCGIDMAFLQNLGWLKIRLFCSREGKKVSEL